MKIDKEFKISVIVSTYNWPNALKLVLEALKRQTDENFEVVVADDGSTQDTKQIIEAQKANYPVPLKHIWQPDLGFRLAKIRNLAINNATGDYFIFLDGDCIPRANFVSNHRKLAEKNYFVTGTRILVSHALTNLVIRDLIQLHSLALNKLFGYYVKGGLNKFLSLLTLPIPRRLSPKNWKLLRGCNFAVWRRDLEDVNGFDESFEGWGFEDSDIAVRLINSGKKRKSGSFSLAVFHLWHDVKNKNTKGANWDRLQERISSKKIYAENGLIKSDNFLSF